MQIIRKNFGLKVLSIALAIVGWAYIRFAANPVIAARFDQQLDLPIAAVNLPPGYIAHFTDKEAVVTVASKRGEPPVKPDAVKAVLDLSNKTAGVYNVPVQLVAPRIQVQSLSPASVTLTVERNETRSFPVSLHYTGQQAGIVIGSARVTPVFVALQGPDSAVAQVSAVRIDVAVPSSPETFDAMLRPRAVDASGSDVAGVDVSPDLVRATIAFTPPTGTQRK